MSTVTIPTDVLPFYKQRTALEGKDYVFTFFWSTRETCWYLNVADASEAEIVSGVKLVCNKPLLQRLALDTKPPGTLMVVSKSEVDDTPPVLADLDPDTGRCELIYIESTS